MSCLPVSAGFLNEINMLKKLQGQDRIVKLYDFEQVDKVQNLVIMCIHIQYVISVEIPGPFFVGFSAGLLIFLRFWVEHFFSRNFASKA